MTSFEINFIDSGDHSHNLNCLDIFWNEVRNYSEYVVLPVCVPHPGLTELVKIAIFNFKAELCNNLP